MAASKTVSFKLGGAALRQLEERAAEAGESVGSQARQLAVANLENHAHRELLHRLDRIEAEQDRFRADLASALETFLLNLAPGLPEDQVREFFSRALRR